MITNRILKKFIIAGALLLLAISNCYSQPDSLSDLPSKFKTDAQIAGLKGAVKYHISKIDNKTSDTTLFDPNGFLLYENNLANEQKIYKNYSSHHNEIECEVYNQNDSLLYHYVRVYNEHGDLLNKYYKNGESTSNRYENESFRYDYDKNGAIIEKSTLKNGEVIQRILYDKKGKTEKEITTNIGIYIYHHKKGGKVVIKQYDENHHEVNKDYYEKLKYDEKDRLIRRCYCYKGTAITCSYYHYDDHDNLIRVEKVSPADIYQISYYE